MHLLVAKNLNVWMVQYARKPNLFGVRVNKHTLVAWVYQIFKIKQNTTNTMLEFYNSM